MFQTKPEKRHLLGSYENCPFIAFKLFLYMSGWVLRQTHSQRETSCGVLSIVLRNAVFTLRGTQGQDVLRAAWFIKCINHILSPEVIVCLKNNDFTSLFTLSHSFLVGTVATCHVILKGTHNSDWVGTSASGRRK